jgi:hypothetical protein
MTILKLIGVATLAGLAALRLRLRLRLLLLLLLSLLLLRYMHCRSEAPIKLQDSAPQDSAPLEPYDISCPENKNCVPPSVPLDGGSP